MAHSLVALSPPAATWPRQPQQQLVPRLQQARGARWGCWPQRLSGRRCSTPHKPAAKTSSGQEGNQEVTPGHLPAADGLARSKPQLQPPQHAWEQARQQVIAFQQQHGRLPRATANATGPLVPGERPLGLWCAEQQRRKAGSKGQPLTVQEQACLVSIPGWSWWPSQRKHVPWEQRLQQVQEFVQQHGRLPRRAQGRGQPFLPSESELGSWVLTQRNCYKGHRQPQLSAKQVAALETVPGWYWAAYAVQPWEQQLRQLKEFVRKHGWLPRQISGSGQPFLPDEKELGAWAHRQRQRYKGQKLPQLSAKQIAALEAVPGWYWAAHELQPWEQWYQQVQDFVQQHDRLPRQKAGSGHPFLPGEKELGAWCFRQRQRWKGNRGVSPPLTLDQQTALQALQGWYWDGKRGRARLGDVVL